MADIELVIKIDEHDKNVIKRLVQGDGCEDFPPSIIEDLIRAVYFGKSLPKGHGRLIDADDVNNHIIGYVYLNSCPTIIEADKGDKE